MFEQLIIKFFAPKNKNGKPDKTGGDKKPVINRKEEITNREEQFTIDEDIEDQSIGGKNEPEIDHPPTEPEKTDKKIPLMDEEEDQNEDES